MTLKVGRFVLRCLQTVYGLFFVLDGALRLIGSARGDPKETFVQPAAEAFNGPVFATPFMDPLLGASFVVAGIALMFRRTTPLGVLILLPSLIVIFLFHAYLTGQIVWGGGHLLFVLLLAWLYRDAFRPLWNYPATAAAGK